MSPASDPPKRWKIWLKCNFYYEKKDIIRYHEPTDCTPNTTQGLLKAHTFDSMNDRFGFAEVRWLLWASVLTWGGGCFEMFS